MEKAIDDTARKRRKKRNRHEESRIEMGFFCYEGKAEEIKVREEECGGVEEEESGKALRRIFKPREQGGKDVKEDREEQGSWGEEVANSIEQ